METVDQINIIYKEIFTIKFLHEGYGVLNQNFISDVINIKPDEETKQLFISHNIGYRFFTDTLICFMECDLFTAPAPDPKIPHVRFNGDVQIRFLINVSTDFLKKTKIVAAGAKQVYHFGNNLNATPNLFICRDEAGVNDINDLKNIDDVQPSEKCFAVMDIHTREVVSPGYALFKVNDTLVTAFPEYQVRFKT